MKIIWLIVMIYIPIVAIVGSAAIDIYYTHTGPYKGYKILKKHYEDGEHRYFYFTIYKNHGEKEINTTGIEYDKYNVGDTLK